jgi:hypothetical protein
MHGISDSKHYKLVAETVECSESTGREWGGNSSFAGLSLPHIHMFVPLKRNR